MKKDNTRIFEEEVSYKRNMYLKNHQNKVATEKVVVEYGGTKVEIFKRLDRYILNGKDYLRK